jgi:MFS family permease
VNKRKISLLLSIVVPLLIVDTSIGKIADLIDKEWILTWGFVLFVFMAAICGLGQYFIGSFVKLKSNEIRNKVSYINIIHKVTMPVQYTLHGIFIFVILQIVLTSYYYTAALTVATTISCSLALAIMIVLAQRFFAWRKSNKNFLVLLYSLSTVLLAIHIGFALAIIDISLLNTQPEKWPQAPGSSSSYFKLTSVLYGVGIVHYAYFVTAILSFILMWAATVLVLHHHFQKKLQKFKFWGIVSLPLAFFLGQFIVLHFDLLVPLLKIDPVFFTIASTIFFTLTLPAGGILFAFAFLVGVKSIPCSSIVRDYITISAIGFILFFVSVQTSILYASYPPFGLVTISFVGLSSYLIVVGIYSSATSLSQDARLRQAIRNSAINQLNFLDSIGAAQTEQELQKRIVRIAKKHADTMAEKTGVESSVNEDDIKQYLKIIIEEMKGMKQQ